MDVLKNESPVLEKKSFSSNKRVHPKKNRVFVYVHDSCVTYITHVQRSFQLFIPKEVTEKSYISYYRWK